MEILAGLLFLGLLLLGGLVLRERGARGTTLSDLRAELARDRDEATRSVIETTVTLARQQLDAARDQAHQADAGRDAVLSEQLTAMSSELDRVRRLVVEMDQQRRDDQGTVKEQLREAIRHARLLAETTDGLRAALDNSRVRGQWGERMADDVLRAFGFREGINHRRQVTTDQGRPDYELFLPQGRSVFMDVKFPLDNYLAWHEAQTRAEADAAAKAFVRDVRNRIKDLAGRGYADPTDVLSVVLLFIPNDGVFGFALEYEPGLLDEALGKGVLLCSPSTLFGVLAVIRQAMDAFRIDQSSTEILEALAGFQDQWGRFTDALDRHGKHLQQATGSFEALATTRRNQLEKALDEVDRLRQDRGLSLPDGGDRDDDRPTERVVTLSVAADETEPAQAS
ncbi:MAG TPA: DNA recombination protein RmuC [Nitriliruptorales bacterium]